MPRVCEFTGRRTHTGNTYTHRGKAKYLGGVGVKVTGKTKRKFKANIQTVTAVMPDGSVRRVKASTKAIRSGMVVKPLKRRFAYRQGEGETAAGAGAAAAAVVSERVASQVAAADEQSPASSTQAAEQAEPTAQAEKTE